MADKRPDWVWVIAIFTYVTVGITVVSMIAAWMLPLSEIEPNTEPLTLFDYAAAGVSSLAAVIAATFLLRLKKAAFYWFAVPFVAWLAVLSWDVVTKGFGEWPRDLEGMFYNLFGFVIGLAICIYCWKLIQRGVLK